LINANSKIAGNCQKRHRARLRSGRAGASGRTIHSPRNILRDSLHKILVKIGSKQDGLAFHSFRRFRVTHLRDQSVPEDILRFWIGHADKSLTDRYSKMKQRIDSRKELAEKAGAGFSYLAPIRNRSA
jgi:integrase